MKITELLMEMANIVISGPGEPPVVAFCRTIDNVGGQHWKSIKVKGPNQVDITVPWDSKKLPMLPKEQNSSVKYTLETAQQFIHTYQFLLDALWNKLIDHDQFLNMYRRSKKEGIPTIEQEIIQLYQKLKSE